jgi:hypothetical protein
MIETQHQRERETGIQLGYERTFQSLPNHGY